jgi:hypothetical protein
MTLSSIGIRIGQVMGKVQPHPVDHCLRLLDREPFIWISMMKPTPIFGRRDVRISRIT